MYQFLVAQVFHLKDHKKPRAIVIDENLIKRIGDDDQQAFATLYQETERALYAYALSLVQHHDDALDVMHDTYLKIRASAHLYKPQGKPMAWIYTIARNLAMDHFRKQARVQEMPGEIENHMTFSYVSDATDRLVLEMTMKALQKEEREIVILHAVNGYKHREIADMLDMPLSTVLSKYRRALHKLRVILEEGGIEHA